MSRDWLAPLTGAAFIALAIIGFAIAGEPPEADNAPQEIVDFYVDNKDSVEVGAALATGAMVLLIFFAHHLRRVLSAAGDATLSATVLVGASIMGVGVAIDSTIMIAIAESAEDIEPASVQTLQAFWDNDFLPIALGSLVFLLSAGISVLKTGALPKWLGWVAVALAVIGFTPLGWIAFLGGGIWILVVSVLLAARGRTTGPSTPPAAA